MDTTNKYDFSGIADLSLDSKINILEFLTGIKKDSKTLSNEEGVWAAKILIYRLLSNKHNFTPKELKPDFEGAS